MLANQVSDLDANDPPDNMVANFSVGFSTLKACSWPIPPFMTSRAADSPPPSPAASPPRVWWSATTKALRPPCAASFLQDLTGDDDPATSDGVFVFNGNNNSVSLGDVVRVTGTAEEYQGQTQISSVTSIVTCGTGTVDPMDLTLPFASADSAEQYEGMLVRLPQTLYVTENYQLGRFGQVVLSSGGRLKQPTNVVAPGAAALALQAAKRPQPDHRRRCLPDAEP